MVREIVLDGIGATLSEGQIVLNSPASIAVPSTWIETFGLSFKICALLFQSGFPSRREQTRVVIKSTDSNPIAFPVSELPRSLLLSNRGVRPRIFRFRFLSRRNRCHGKRDRGAKQFCRSFEVSFVNWYCNTQYTIPMAIAKT